MRLLSFILFLILFSGASFGEDIHAELHLVSSSNVFKEGDLVEGVVKVWPIENEDLSEFKQIENMIFANSLIVTELESVSLSVNNTDVVEAKVLMIAKRLGESSVTPLNYKGHSLFVKTPELKIVNSEIKNAEYFIMDQGSISSHLGKIISGLLFVLVLLTLFWKGNKIKKWLHSFKENPIALATKKHNEMFTNANLRQDYESVYAKRNEWQILIKIQDPAYAKFFNTMELYQYKKSWSEEELCEIKNDFDIIRGSFK